MPSPSTASRTGLFAPPLPPQGSPELSGRLTHFLGPDELYHNTHNGFAEGLGRFSAVHGMHTEGHAAKFGRVGDAADTQHLQEGEGGRAQHCREAAQGCAKIRPRRYETYNMGALRKLDIFG
jgi:hypothetical protein